MTIRLADDGDIDAMQRVGEAAWHMAYRFAGEDYISHGLQQWWSGPALLQSLRETTVLVAEQDGRIAGVGNLDVRGPVPIIWKLYVHPDAHGTGLGSALLEQLLAAAPPDAAAVQLEYVAGNEQAAAFYQHKGFREIGTEPAARPGWPGTVWVERQLARDESTTPARSTSRA